MEPSTEDLHSSEMSFRMSSVAMLINVLLTFAILWCAYTVLDWLTSGFTKLLYGYVVPVSLPPVIQSFFTLIFGIIVFRIFMLWYNTFYILSPSQVGRKSGIFSKKTTMVAGKKWSVVGVSQGVVGRLFNYGTILLKDEESHVSYALINVHDPAKKSSEIQVVLAHGTAY